MRQVVLAARLKEREERLAALADGRRQRSTKFTPKKGKGSYRRPARHQLTKEHS